MSLLTRFTSCARGLGWLVRGSGLRDQLDNLRRENSALSAKAASLLTELREVTARAANAPPGVIARLDALEIQTRQFIEAQLRDAEIRLKREMLHNVDAELRVRQAERWRQAGDLRGFERKVFSQNGEDGILREIFQRIGTTNKFFVEFGVESGEECNCRYLVERFGWGGLFLEPMDAEFAQLADRYKKFSGVRCGKTIVTPDNIEGIFAEHRVPTELDLLSIDIDGNDYWVWNAVVNFRPRVVMTEFNPFYPPPRKWVMKRNDQHRWDGSSYFGASLASFAALGDRKGYDLVCTDSRGVNAFFVRRDCIRPGKFLDPSLHYHYSPFTYHPLPTTGEGPYEEI